MRPFFCRQGSKRKYSKALVSLFPAHQTYVEPFLGGGAVFWEKQPSPKEVLNDLDSDLVADYRRLYSAPASGYPILTTESAQNEFLRTSHSGKAAQIVESLLRRCNGFGGTYIEKGTSKGVYTDDRKGRVHKVTTHEDKLKNISAYRARLKDASLTNESYDVVLRKHDSPDTFFFMDPPYEKSVGLDYAEGSDKFPFAKFAEDVRKLKGKFLITINDSRAIRKLFKGLHIYAYVVKGHHAKSAIGKEDRKELLITNYDLPRNWKSRMTKGVLTGGRFHCEDEEEELVGAGRGDIDIKPAWVRANKAIDPLRPLGGGCAVFGLAALQDYMNTPIDIRRAQRLAQANGDGGLVDDQVLGLLLESGINQVETEVGNPNLAPDVVGAAVAWLETEGHPLLLSYIDHIIAVLPKKKVPADADRPYEAWLFDCQAPEPINVTGAVPQTPVETIFQITNDPFERGKGKTHRESVLKTLGLPKDGHSVAELAKASGVSEGVLQKVYNRGIGAYKTNPESVRMKGTYEKGVDAPMSQKLSKEQWAMARVYSFLDGNPKHDTDLRGGKTGLDVAKEKVKTLQEKVKDLRIKLATEKDLPWVLRERGAIEAYEEELAEAQTALKDAVNLLAKFTADPASAVPDWGTRNPSWWKRLTGSAGGGKAFEVLLGKVGYAPATYIRDVRKKARKAGVDPRMVGFANDGVHKLEVHTPDGRTVKFGRVGYGDHLMWTHMERRGDVPKGVAETKRRVFRISHSAIRGNWRSDRFSPNNLALALLW